MLKITNMRLELLTKHNQKIVLINQFHNVINSSVNQNIFDSSQFYA